jgi:hypothetical protein
VPQPGYAAKTQTTIATEPRAQPTGGPPGACFKRELVQYQLLMAFPHIHRKPPCGVWTNVAVNQKHKKIAIEVQWD